MCCSAGIFQQSFEDKPGSAGCRGYFSGGCHEPCPIYQKKMQTPCFLGVQSSRCVPHCSPRSASIGDQCGICCWANDSCLSQPEKQDLAFLFIHFHPLLSLFSPHFSLGRCSRPTVPSPRLLCSNRGQGRPWQWGPSLYRWLLKSHQVTFPSLPWMRSTKRDLKGFTWPSFSVLSPLF